MALGLAYEGSRWCVVLTVTAGGAVVNVFVPPGGGFLDQTSANNWGTLNVGSGQTATSFQIQTAA